MHPHCLGSLSLSNTPLSIILICRVYVAEMQERHNKGSCFNCDDKISLSHRCKRKQFLLLLEDELVDPKPTTLLQLEMTIGNSDIDIAIEAPAIEVFPIGENFQLSYATLMGVQWCQSSFRSSMVTNFGWFLYGYLVPFIHFTHKYQTI